MTDAIIDVAVNPNLQWAQILVNELANCGLTAVCIAPGSRSTPLTLAFHQHPAIHVFLHLDERSAGFSALGHALATDAPVALVCTSGTAAAEFFPAVIEARQSHVPLLVLTSDRPHELRHSGANQTIDQVKLFGDQVLWSVDMAVPDRAAADVVLRNVARTACRAYATANGLRKGPVHLNLPFRKPLEPADLAELARPDVTMPGAYIAHGILQPTAEQIRATAALLRAHPNGLIICGPRCPGGEFPQAVTALARAAGYPILADPLSGVRHGAQVAPDGLILGGYETFLKAGGDPWPTPDLILRFGAAPTSKWLNAYLSNQPARHHLHVRVNGVWADEHHLTTALLQVDESIFCTAVTAVLPPQESPGSLSTWAAQFAAAEAFVQQTAAVYTAAHWFDGAVITELLAAAPAGSNLFVGNSLPIRHMDQFGKPSSKPLDVYANRGASGIDGTTSTALGIAAARPNQRLIFVTGDVAFYHDLNGLLAIRQHDLHNVIIVLLNNNGGSIFRRLPVAQLEPAFTPLFLTPHGLDFAHAAALYQLEHRRCTQRDQFQQAFNAALTSPQPTLIEVITDGADDLRHQRAFVQQATQFNRRTP